VYVQEGEAPGLGNDENAAAAANPQASPPRRKQKAAAPLKTTKTMIQKADRYDYSQVH